MAGKKKKRIDRRRGKPTAIPDSVKLGNAPGAGTDTSNPIADPLPTTPFDVVYAGGLLRLRRYRTEQGPTHSPPVLLVYSLIKRPYVLDNAVGKDNVEAAIAKLEFAAVPYHRLDVRT